METSGMTAVKRVLAVPTAMVCLIIAAAFPAGAETLIRQHLDAGRVQFSGMDINGDGFADSIRLDRVKQSLFYFVGSEKGNFTRFSLSSISEEDRRFVPDLLLEKDLDGDEIEDLLLYNRAYIEKYLSQERTFSRILAGGIYIGQPRGRYVTLKDAALSAEARAAVLKEARNTLFPEP